MDKCKCICEPQGSIIRYVASDTKDFEKIVGEDGVAEYELGTNCYTWIGLALPHAGVQRRAVLEGWRSRGYQRTEEER